MKDECDFTGATWEKFFQRGTMNMKLMEARIRLAARQAERDDAWPPDELHELAAQVAAELGLLADDTMRLQKSVADCASSICGAEGEHLTDDEDNAAFNGELADEERSVARVPS